MGLTPNPWGYLIVDWPGVGDGRGAGEAVAGRSATVTQAWGPGGVQRASRHRRFGCTRAGGGSPGRDLRSLGRARSLWRQQIDLVAA